MKHWLKVGLVVCIGSQTQKGWAVFRDFVEQTPSQVTETVKTRLKAYKDHIDDFQSWFEEKNKGNEKWVTDFSFMDARQNTQDLLTSVEKLDLQDPASREGNLKKCPHGTVIHHHITS